MTTWTMDQVRRAESLRASLVVDAELIARDPDFVRDAAVHEMAKYMAHLGHPYGLELHEGDFEAIWERSDSTPWQVTGRLRWHPRTNAVELRGGYFDGQRYAVRVVGEPLRVPRVATTPWLEADAGTAEAALTEMAETYELAGWREDERVWVYEAR